MRLPLPAGVIVAATLTLLTGCGGADPDDDVFSQEEYYEQMRSMDAFRDQTDAELDALADSACGLVDVVVEMGGTNEDAVDAVFQTALDTGLSEPDALLASITIVGANCPIDISQ